MNNFTQRLLSGIVYTVVVTCAIVLSRDAADVLFLILSLLAVREYHVICVSPMHVIVWSLAATVPLFMTQCSQYSAFWYVVLGMVLFGSFIYELFSKAEIPMENWGRTLVSLVMISLPFSLIANMLRLGEWEVHRWVVLALFVCIWANDTGAYCVGSLIGRHKMFPRVSPGKSWEGLVGGFVFSLLAGYIFSLCVADYALWQWLLIALFCSVFGTFGDLLESLLKRTMGIKDSGKFLPGHGGVLDRFDSVLLAAPSIWILLMIFSLVG